MKGNRQTAFLLAALFAFSAVQPALAADWQSGNPLIAHAFGEVDMGKGIPRGGRRLYIYL